MGRDLFLHELFRREYYDLYRYAARLTGDGERGKDLLQEAFLLALLHQRELEGHPAPALWLKRTLLNLIRNERRRAARRGEVSLEALPRGLLAREDPLPLDAVLPASLSREDRQLLIWRFEDQLDDGAIARRLGISPGAARMRLSRALARCRKAMEDNAER